MSPNPHTFWGGEKENTRTVATGQAEPARGGGSAPRRPNPGLVCPYRSGSGSSPQCCGPRTRTKAPPSSRQGTPRVSLTPRTTSVSAPRPGSGHTSGWRQQRRASSPGDGAGAAGNTAPLSLEPQRRRGAGRERKKGRGAEKRE